MTTTAQEPTSKRGGRFYNFVVQAGQTLPINVSGKCFMVLSSLLPLFIQPDGQAQSIYWDGLGLIVQDEWTSLQVSIPSSITFNGTAKTSFTIWLWIGYDKPLVAQQFTPYWRRVVAASDYFPGTSRFIQDQSGSTANVYILGSGYQAANEVIVPVIYTRRSALIFMGSNAGAPATIAVTPNASFPSAGHPVAVAQGAVLSVDAASDFYAQANVSGPQESYIDVYESIPNCPN